MLACRLIILICLLSTLACQRKEQAAIFLDLDKVSPTTITQRPLMKSLKLKVAICSMITPHIGSSYYRMLAEYLGEKLNREISLTTKDMQADINNFVGTDDIDLAFVGGQTYVEAHEKNGAEILVAPQVRGTTTYYSYIIVPSDAPTKNLSDLRGKSFAFTYPTSLAGTIIPTMALAAMNEKPETFFASTIFTYSHDTSIESVAKKLVDGAAVDSLVWHYMETKEHDFTSYTKIIWKSAPFATSPVVVRKNLNPKLKQELKDIFLNLHNDPKGKIILNGLLIEKFVETKDSVYRSIRDLKGHFGKKN